MSEKDRILEEGTKGMVKIQAAEEGRSSRRGRHSSLRTERLKGSLETRAVTQRKGSDFVVATSGCSHHGTGIYCYDLGNHVEKIGWSGGTNEEVSAVSKNRC